ncbi:hypothetical protein BDZ45DRAFT_766166 [Acephala macrosclerotiorum]|nr:hypothetical protein BDZ45DRAFT_766166 [Acephala macrosclerotiorum]
MTTRTKRFQRKPAEKTEEPLKEEEEEEEVTRFSPKEEAIAANNLFAKASFQNAINIYDQALFTHPNYLDYEAVVLKNNITAGDTLNKGKREADIGRIRAKALTRRARAKDELGGWANLAGAEEDYKTLEKMQNLSIANRKIIQRQLILLPPRTKAAQEKEMGDMMGKLKEPFGLSTDNVLLQENPNTAGYSMNFNQGGPASK